MYYEPILRVLSSLLDVILKGASYLVAYYLGKKEEASKVKEATLRKKIEVLEKNKALGDKLNGLSNDEVERQLEQNGWLER